MGFFFEKNMKNWFLVRSSPQKPTSQGSGGTNFLRVIRGSLSTTSRSKTEDRIFLNFLDYFEECEHFYGL